ncbi:MAG: hypothetical protein IPI44_22265 [Sulfuritalea sp.]|nr:hypothetical protein [Sulfuritalea sp.]
MSVRHHERNLAAALIVAAGGLKDPAVMVMVLMGAVVGLALMLGMARLLCTRLASVN